MTVGRRRTRAAIALLAATLVALGGAALLPRALERATVAWLAQRGVTASLRVERLGPYGVALSDVRLGDDLRVARVEAGFRPGALASGVVDSIALADAELRVEIRDDGLSFGSLEPLFGGGAGDEAPGAPVLSVARGRVEAVRVLGRTPLGPAELRLDGDWDLTGAAPAGRLSATLRHAAEAARADATLSLAAGELAAALELAVARPEAVGLAGETGLAAPAGAHLDLRAALADPPASLAPGALLAWLEEAAWRGTLDVDAPAVRAGGVTAGVQGTLGLGAERGRWELAGNPLHVTFGGSWQAAVALRAAARRDGAGLAIEELQLASDTLGGGGVRLGPVSLAAAGHLDGDRFAGDVRLEATALDLQGVAPALRALPATLRSRAHVDAGRDGVSARGDGCAEVALAAGAVGGVRLRGRHALCLAPAGDAPLVEVRRAESGAAVALRARLAPFALDLEDADGPLARGETPAFVVQADVGADGTRLRIEADGGSLRFPGAGLEARGARLALALPSLAPLRYAGTLSLDALRVEGEPAPVAPLRAELRADGDARAVRFALSARDAGAALALEASGAHDLASGRGSARLATAPLRFEPDRVQPAQLFPIVGARVARASGELSARGALAWNARGLFPDLTLALRSVSAEASGVTVEKLSGDVRVLRFSPFVTTPAQELRFERLAAGALLTDGLVRFGVSEGPRIEGFAATAGFAGGALELRGSLDLRASRQELLLSLDGVEIAELLAIEPVEGLAANGRLRGRVPLVLAGDELRIEGARIGGTGAGVVRYRPAQPLALVPGEAGRLVDRSLENFHYDVLVLDVEGSNRGRTHAKLHLEGRNPDLDQLQPVHLNLALDTNYGEVLEQVLQLKRLSERLLSRRTPAAARK